MKFTIKKRFSDEVLVEGKAKSFKDFVEANKSNLRGSDLRGSDLRGSDLSGSNLSYSNLRDSKIKITQKDEIIKALGTEVVE